MAQQNQRNKYALQETRLPLIGAMTNRDQSGIKDQRFINIFPETRKVEAIESTKIFLNKRPGLSLYKNYGAGNGRGAAWFRNRFYLAIDGKIWEDGATPTAVITLTDATTKVGMLVANSSSIGDYLFICDGTSGWVIKDDGTVIIIDPTALLSVVRTSAGTGYTDGTYNCTFTGGGGAGAAATYTVSGTVVTSINVTNYGTGYTSAPTVSFPSGGGSGASAVCNLNSFPTPHIPMPTFIDGYILLAKGSDVYNCVLDTPTSWASGEYLSAEMFPDPIVGLARQNNQVVVFGSSSIEFLYDAANTAGSPLNRNESSTIQMGCAFPYAIYQNEKNFIFVSQSESGGRAVWQVDGFQPKKVSDEYIDRIIDKETDPSNVHGFGFRTMGHLFYLVNLPTLGRTLVYDTEEKLWHEWSTNVADVHDDFFGYYMVDNQSGSCFILHKSNGSLYKLDTTAYNDAGTSIITEIITNRYDMNSYKRKFMTNLRIVGDRYLVGDDNKVTCRWTDDDYLTWSNYKTIELTDDFPNWARLGSFRRRAFNIKHIENKPLRLESIEVSFYEGDS